MALTRMPAGPKLERGDLHQHRRPRLRRAVRAHADSRLHRVEAGGDHDRARALHGAGRVLDREEGTHEADVDDTRPVVDLRVDDAGARPDAGIGERDIEPTEALDGDGHQALHVTLDGHVARSRRQRSADLRVQRVERLLVPIADHDRGALANEPAGGREPDAGGAARDHGDLALQATARGIRLHQLPLESLALTVGGRLFSVRSTALRPGRAARRGGVGQHHMQFWKLLFSPRREGGPMDFQPIDADNHYYEPLDAFTRHLDPKYRARGVRPVQEGTHTQLLVGGRVNQFVPNPTFDPIIVPGCLDPLFRGQIPEGVDPRTLMQTEPMRSEYRDRDERVRSPRVAGSRVGDPLPDPGLRGRGSAPPGHPCHDGHPVGLQPVARGRLGLRLPGSPDRGADDLARRSRRGTRGGRLPHRAWRSDGARPARSRPRAQRKFAVPRPQVPRSGVGAARRGVDPRRVPPR